jgi:hypothetical protein
VLRYLPFVVEIGLLVYCLIDCIQADEGRIRNLSRTGWLILIVILPVAGGVAWLVAGRPKDERRRQVPWPSTGTAGFPEYERPRRGPDDDPEFLDRLRRDRESDGKHEQMLRDWEAQLREREQRLGEPEGGTSGTSGA